MQFAMQCLVEDVGTRFSRNTPITSYSYRQILFGFPATADVDSPEILNSKRFKMHAAYMIQVRSARY